MKSKRLAAVFIAAAVFALLLMCSLGGCVQADRVVVRDSFDRGYPAAKDFYYSFGGLVFVDFPIDDSGYIWQATDYDSALVKVDSLTGRKGFWSFSIEGRKTCWTSVQFSKLDPELGEQSIKETLTIGVAVNASYFASTTGSEYIDSDDYALKNSSLCTDRLKFAVSEGQSWSAAVEDENIAVPLECIEEKDRVTFTFAGASEGETTLTVNCTGNGADGEIRYSVVCGADNSLTFSELERTGSFK